MPYWIGLDVCTRRALSDILHKPKFALLLPLFECILCTPASSAPVERVFSQNERFDPIVPECQINYLNHLCSSNVTDVGYDL